MRFPIGLGPNHPMEVQNVVRAEPSLFEVAAKPRADAVISPMARLSTGRSQSGSGGLSCWFPLCLAAQRE